MKSDRPARRARFSVLHCDGWNTSLHIGGAQGENLVGPHTRTEHEASEVVEARPGARGLEVGAFFVVENYRQNHRN